MAVLNPNCHSFADVDVDGCSFSLSYVPCRKPSVVRPQWFYERMFREVEWDGLLIKRIVCCDNSDGDWRERSNQLESK